jgi:CheY-like chemotaxis protein
MNGGAAVLVVDDSDSKRYVLASWLRRAGHTVVEAATGQEALRLVQAGVPDLAVLDVKLPDISGLEVCRQIKRARRCAGVPVLHVSAIAVATADRSIGLDVGADAYLVDPIEPREFLSTVGALLRQSRRFAEEHRIALTLQRSLLPATLPDLDGLRITARYHASADEAEIGGDFFDAFELPGGDALVVIGDVQGHSLAAAVIMAELRYSLRAYAFDGHPPAAVIERLNRLMLSVHPDTIATVCVLAFPPDRSEVTIVNAGHLPPLLISPEGAEYLDGGAGVLLGLDGPAPVPERVALTPGTRLLLMTDGLVERRSMPLADSMDELARTLASAHRADPAGRLKPSGHSNSGVGSNPGVGSNAGVGSNPGVGSVDELADYLLRRADSSDDDVALVVIETTATATVAAPTATAPAAPGPATGPPRPDAADRPEQAEQLP